MLVVVVVVVAVVVVVVVEKIREKSGNLMCSGKWPPCAYARVLAILLQICCNTVCNTVSAMAYCVFVLLYAAE